MKGRPMWKSFSTRVWFPILAPVAHGHIPALHAAKANKKATAATRHGMRTVKTQLSHAELDTAANNFQFSDPFHGMRLP